MAKATIEQIQSRVKSKRFKVIRRSEDPNYVIVQCSVCNSEARKLVQSLYKSDNPECHTCYARILEAEASKHSLKLIGPGLIDRPNFCDYRQYQLICGHTKEMTTSSVRNYIGEVRCDECYIKDLSELVPSKGNFILKRKLDISSVEITCMNCHKDSIHQVSNIRHGNFNCPFCSEHSLLRPSSVYLFHMKYLKKEWLKLGHSVNPYLRYLDFGLKQGVQSKFLYSVKFDTGYQAREKEQQIFKSLNHFRLPAQEMREILSSGFTECLDMKALPYLDEYLRELILTEKKE